MVLCHYPEISVTFSSNYYLYAYQFIISRAKSDLFSIIQDVIRLNVGIETFELVLSVIMIALQPTPVVPHLVVHQVEAGSVNGYRIAGCQDPDVRNDIRTAEAIAVTKGCNVHQYVDIRSLSLFVQYGALCIFSHPFDECRDLCIPLGNDGPGRTDRHALAAANAFVLSLIHI